MEPNEFLVSIVTPSYNQAPYLEQTILSILNQSYKNIEHIVIDGGSNDGSVEIIKKHESRLAYWHSRRDRGFGDAINQGWNKSKGSILSWVNSDDLLSPDAVQTVVDIFTNHPDVDLVYGNARIIDASGLWLRDFPSEPFDAKKVFTTWEDPIRQPAAFFRRNVFQRFGGLDETFHFCIDFEYWVRIWNETKFLHIPEYLASARMHPASKTSTLESTQARELMRLCNRVVNGPLLNGSGVSPKEAWKGLYFRVSQNFRNAQSSIQALKAYLRYCLYAFSPPEACYRFLRYTAGMLWRGK
jgi:glycosyltransferase involved in cell wall biosynthesis